MEPYEDPRRTPQTMTGTDAPPVLGFSPWASAIDVWDRIVNGTPRPDISGPDVERGRHMEPGIRAWYSERTGRPVLPGRFCLHPEIDWLGASTDGLALASESRILEIKCPRSSKDWGEPGTDEVPDWVLAQVIVEMACHRVSADVVLFAHGDISIYPIERDLAAERDVIRALSDWRERYVLTRTPPPPDATDGYARYLARRGQASEAMREATVQTRAWAAQLRRARNMAAEAERLEAEAKNHLCSEIGDAAGIVCPIDGWRITWKQAKPTRKTHWQAVAKDCAVPQDVIERHTRLVEGSRRFLARFDSDEE